MEFELNGNEYRVGKLTAFQQFHTSRKIAPILPTLVPVFVKLAKQGSLMSDLSGLGETLAPFSEGIASIPDADGEFVLNTCLSVVQRKNGDSWVPVWSQSHKVVMFDDIDLWVMINLAIRVIRDSLGPFIQGLLSSQAGSPASE